MCLCLGQKNKKNIICNIVESAFLNHILAKIYGFNRFRKECHIEPLDTVVNKTDVFEVAKNEKHLVDVLQVIVIQE